MRRSGFFFVVVLLCIKTQQIRSSGMTVKSSPRLCVREKQHSEISDSLGAFGRDAGLWLRRNC